MIDDGQMLAYAGRDVRAMLRLVPDDARARRLGWLKVESSGNPCPPNAFDAAVDSWLAIGAPEPQPAKLCCPLCEDETLEPLGDGAGFACGDCDLVLGASWNDRVADLRALERFAERELWGNTADWWERPRPAWAVPPPA